MVQIGKVIATTESDARVTVQRGSACGENCAMCKGGCVPTKHTAVVKNTAGAEVGDVVKVETDDGAVLKSAALVYVLPILILFVCYALAQKIAENGVVAVCAGMAGLVAGFLILRAVDRKVAPVPEIIQVIYGKSREED